MRSRVTPNSRPTSSSCLLYTSLANGGYPEESDLYLIVGDKLLDCVRAAPVQEHSCEVALQKSDGTWRLTDEGSAALGSTLVGQ